MGDGDVPQGGERQKELVLQLGEKLLDPSRRLEAEVIAHAAAEEDAVSREANVIVDAPLIGVALTARPADLLPPGVAQRLGQEDEREERDRAVAHQAEPGRGKGSVQADAKGPAPPLPAGALFFVVLPCVPGVKSGLEVSGALELAVEPLLAREFLDPVDGRNGLVVGEWHPLD